MEEPPAFWQRRFYDFNVWSEKKLKEKLLDMQRNPVRRKLVQHPKDWPWSSCSFYAKGEGLIEIDLRGTTQQQRKPAPLDPKGAAPAQPTRRRRN
jgi:putative transposase